jgi:hypothetical protein
VLRHETVDDNLETKGNGEIAREWDELDQKLRIGTIQNPKIGITYQEMLE